MAELTVRSDLAAKLNEIAQRENRAVDEVLETLLSHYELPTSSIAPENLEASKKLRSRLYKQARQYWQQTNDQERLKLTDDELDAQFWLIDDEGVPHLKSEQDKVILHPNSLTKLAEKGREMDFQAEESDISNRSREILDQELADHLTRHTDSSPNG